MAATRPVSDDLIGERTKWLPCPRRINNLNLLLDFINVLYEYLSVLRYVDGHFQSSLSRLQSAINRHAPGLPHLQTDSRRGLRSLPARQTQPRRSSLCYRLRPPPRLAEKNGKHFWHQLSHRQKSPERHRRRAGQKFREPFAQSLRLGATIPWRTYRRRSPG